MIRSFDASTTAVTPDGSGITALATLTEADGLSAGVWTHDVGESDGDFGAEVFVVLAGRGHVADQHGGRIDLAPGVVGVLESGDLTHWTIVEPLRKVWIVAGD
jgi:uncharacterized protein